MQRASAQVLVMQSGEGTVEVRTSVEEASVAAFDGPLSEGPPGAGVERVGRRPVALPRIGRSRVFLEGYAF